MKKVITLALVVASFTIGCAMEGNDDSVMTQDETLETQAVGLRSGYCVVANGAYTGKCRTKGTTCSQSTVNVAACTVGVPTVALTSACGITVDAWKACSF
jgi:hypothetical protein